MPGSWEIEQHKANSVYVAILTRETVTTAWAANFKRLVVPGQFDFFSGMPFDHARNTACHKFLSLGWDWLFFLDDDVLCPPDTILRLVNHNQPIISGVYYRRNEPICPVMLHDTPEGRAWVRAYPPNTLLEVHYVGAGCLLIHRSVLTSLPALSARCHWFDWRVDREDLPGEQRTSEDFTFCWHARQHGYRLLVDTSIICRHAGLSASGAGGLAPLVP